MARKQISLTSDSVYKTITKMALGMLLGMIAMSAFNAADTFFVGKLGVNELAAMSFTFPVVMVLNSISLGLGVGLSSTVSRAIGSGDSHKVKRLTTDGLILALLIVILVTAIGIFSIEPLFSTMGASGSTLELVINYMFIWFLGLPFVVIPMAGNNVIRATGDTLTPSIIMMASVFVNIILDPLLIFGIGPFPMMGIKGAAIATVLARFTTFIFSLYILGVREKLLSFKKPILSETLSSWREIAFIGLPAAMVQAINPLSLGIVTRLLSNYGEEVVAGYGAAGRVEMLIMIIPMSLSTVVAPFTGQNWGAKKIDRIIKGLRFSAAISVSWGIIISIVFYFISDSVLSLFNPDPNIIKAGADYLRIASISYGFAGTLFIASQSFNALKKPLYSAAITILKAFVLTIPLSLAGGFLWNETGIFNGIMISNIFSGITGFYIINNTLSRQINIY